MKKVILTSVFALLFILTNFTFVSAQSSVDNVVKEWERAKAYTKEFLDAMPESAYSSKPTPTMRSFSEQMLHLTDANYNFGASATGQQSPMKMGEAEKTTDKSKANVTKIVLEGYDFIISGIKKMTPDQLNQTIKLFGKFDLTRQQVLDKDFEHQTHHRAQTVVYLRLAGITPPQEKLF